MSWTLKVSRNVSKRVNAIGGLPSREGETEENEENAIKAIRTKGVQAGRERDDVANHGL